MRKIHLGIFLMLLSIWCLIFGTLDNVTLFLFIGVYLPIVAIIFFSLVFLIRISEINRAIIHM